MIARKVLWSRVHPSILPSFHFYIFLSGRFLWIGSLVFYKFWNGFKIYMNLWVTERIFWKKIICLQDGSKSSKITAQKWNFPLNTSFLDLGQFLAIESSLKEMKNAFYFMYKSSLCSWGFYIFVRTFWLCRKSAW